MRRVLALAATVLFVAPASATDTPKNDILIESDGIYSMRSDGGNQRRLTSGRYLDGEASWSPDGTRIVFARYRADTRNWDLYSMTGSGQQVRRLTRTSASERNPSWSPSGRWIAFDRGVKGIFLMSPRGTKVKRFSPRGVTEALPTWSPDSRRLAFLSDRRDPPNFDLFVSRRDGSRAKRIRDLGGEVLGMDWGRSGWIAMDYSARRGGVFVLRPSGDRFHRVGRRTDVSPVWGPSGEKLLVFNQRDDLFGIWVMNKDGSNRMHITEEGSPLDWISR